MIMSQERSTQTNIKHNKLNWVNILFLTITPVAAAVAIPAYIYTQGWSWPLLWLGLSFFAIFNLSITAGYHRYFSHRSYEAHPFLEFLYVWFGSGAFQGSVLEWCYDHRKHHLKIDTEEDPYNINKGFWYAHFFWMFYQNNEGAKFPPDLTKKKLLVLQNKYYVLFAIASGFLMPAVAGYFLLDSFVGGLLWGGLARVVITQHSTFFVNSIAHTFGSQPYNPKNSARDSLFVSLLTFGEGYHNFHHHFQSDYRCAVKWYQWDPTKWLINTMRSMRLVKKVKRFSKYEIMLARMHADAQRITAKTPHEDKIAALKLKVEDAQKRVRLVMAEYERMKSDFQEQSREKYKMLKADIKIAQLEFHAAYDQWRVYIKAVRQYG